jgi:hypothetical protein
MVTNNLHFENVRKIPAEIYCKKVSITITMTRKQVKIEKDKDCDVQTVNLLAPKIGDHNQRGSHFGYTLMRVYPKCITFGLQNINIKKHGNRCSRAIVA